MAAKVRKSERGNTLYVEHGVFYDAATRRIHVTIPGAGKGAHWPVGRTHKQYPLYKRILEENGIEVPE